MGTGKSLEEKAGSLGAVSVWTGSGRKSLEGYVPDQNVDLPACGRTCRRDSSMVSIFFLMIKQSGRKFAPACFHENPLKDPFMAMRPEKRKP